MFVGQKFFHKIFAPVSLGFLLLCPAVGFARAEANSTSITATVKRDAASSQFQKAEEQRAALNNKPAEKRTLADYRQVVSSYRRVYLITPHANEVPDSLLAIAELYTEMGDRFGRSYYQSSVDSYQFLIHEYPTSRYCQDAVLRIAKLQRDQLGDPNLAAKTYEDFLKKYPRSSRKREAQEALAELALLRNSDSPAPAKNSAASKKNAQKAAQEEAETTSAPMLPPAEQRSGSSGIPRIRRIRTNTSGDTTRVTIDLEDTVQYSSGRIANPDRIFFDLHAARLTPEVARGNISVDGTLLTAVRVAQNQSGVVRVVLDIHGVKDYSASLLNNPPQLVIDLYGSAKAMRAAKSKRAEQQAAANDSPDANTSADSTESTPAKSSTETAAKKTDVDPTQVTPPNPMSPSNGTVAGDTTSAAVRNTLPSAKSSRSRSAKASSAKPDLIQPTRAPQPTRDGQATLTRTLGLKIGRIVIDAGHGGHDTGTIGPTGLMEKDLCLDVALRLGKIIQQKLPGADVVYTRSDDTFIPLEERTRIANEAKADLFISIHANSSRDSGARGIETYYLNLKGSAEAMEVAARENATSQEGIHDLQDIVKQIARTEKIDESREFAEDVQNSLTARVQKVGKSVKNRGVRKAPFVVLIGADMPSILTEISFLSNPSDEQLLKKPEHRQRVAEGIFQGVSSYLENLNSVTVNLPPRTPANSTSAVASSGTHTTPVGGSSSVEQTRNPQ